MSLKDMLASDMAAVFLNSDEFAEAITYRKRSGTTRSIKAIIDRHPPATREEMAEGRVPKLTITVANSATTGVSAGEWDRGEAFLVRTQLGQDIETHSIAGPPDAQDDGALTWRW